MEKISETTTSSLRSDSATGDRPTEQGVKFPASAQRGIYAALGCTSLDFKSQRKLEQAAGQIASFAMEALCDDGFVVVRKDVVSDLVEALRESWNLVAEMKDASLKGLPLLPADRERIAESVAASRSAIAKATGAA